MFRYYNTFDVPVAYEFGYGLSYTTFEYSKLNLSSTRFDGTLTVTVDVKNTGSVAGREVVQVYASAPDEKMEKPEEELVAFAKTRLLQPDESETVSFSIAANNLASFDEITSEWIAEAGTYKFKMGASSLKIEQMADFSLVDKIIVEKVSKALVPKRKFQRLSSTK